MPNKIDVLDGLEKVKYVLAMIAKNLMRNLLKQWIL